MYYKKAPEQDIDYVLGILETIYPVSIGLKEAFYEKTVCLKIKKGKILVREGEQCQYMYFIKHGALMGQTKYQKKEIVTYISIENEFVSSISGLHGAAPSQEAIIAVEDSELLAMHNDDLQTLFLNHFDMNFLFRVMVEKYYRDAQERAHIIRLGNVKERYFYFVNTKPGYIERLPLPLVASLLDMKPATLMKIQKQHQISRQKDRENKKWCRMIEHYIIKEEAFKNADLSLSHLSEVFSISPHRLSAIFNNIYHLNFVNFVNQYRINHIKQQMNDTEAMRHYTIETLAKNAGFTSRSAFYNAFKKATGMSPAQYRKDVK
ncbi:MAG: helix-turn-helix domain-containing protein [Bergeyella sp.]